MKEEYISQYSLNHFGFCVYQKISECEEKFICGPHPSKEYSEDIALLLGEEYEIIPSNY